MLWDKKKHSDDLEQFPGVEPFWFVSGSTNLIELILLENKKTFAGLVCLRSSFYPDKFKCYTITMFNNDPSLLKNKRNL